MTAPRDQLRQDAFVVFFVVAFMLVGAIPFWATGDGAFLFMSAGFGFLFGRLMLWLVMLPGGRA